MQPCGRIEQRHGPLMQRGAICCLGVRSCPCDERTQASEQRSSAHDQPHAQASTAAACSMRPTVRKSPSAVASPVSRRHTSSACPLAPPALPALVQVEAVGPDARTLHAWPPPSSSSGAPMLTLLTAGISSAIELMGCVYGQADWGSCGSSRPRHRPFAASVWRPRARSAACACLLQTLAARFCGIRAAGMGLARSARSGCLARKEEPTHQQRPGAAATATPH